MTIVFANIQEARRYAATNQASLLDSWKGLMDLCEHLDREKRGLHSIVEKHDDEVRNLNAQLNGMNLEAADLIDEIRRLESKIEMLKASRRQEMSSLTG